MAKKTNLQEVTDQTDAPTEGQPAKEPKSEDDIIWLAISSLRNRAKKLSPEGRAKLFGMVRGFIG